MLSIETLCVLKSTTRKEVKEYMKEENGKKDMSYIEKEKKDSEEILEILQKVPIEKKGEILGIVKGFALCAESAKVKEAM